MHLKTALQNRATWVALSLAAMALLVYAPVFQADFVNYDDPLYVTANVDIQEGLSGESIAWAFHPGSIVAGNWHPLTAISHMLDVQLYGLDPAGHHATNVLLHALSAIGLFFVLRSATGAFWRSVAVAALFTLHPVNVESVAWISERKNVLSTFFWILTVGAHVAYARRPSARRLTITTLALALGLLAKPMLVTLPFVLLLFDYWPLRRIRGRALIIEKLPMFALVLLVSAVTLHVQSDAGAISGLDDEPLSYRASNATIAYATYLAKLAWPRNLSPFYPFPAQAPPVLWVSFLLLGLVAVTASAIAVRRHAPYFLMGWLWYLGVLVPVIGLVQVGNQAMADRYLHVPAIGIFIVVVWALGSRLGRSDVPRRTRIVAAVASAAIVLVLGWSTREQAARWDNSETLFRYATHVSDCNYFAHNNLGVALVTMGRLDEGLTEFQRAVACLPQDPSSQMNLGTTYLQLHRFADAERHLRLAVQLRPGFAEAHANLGASLMQLHRFDEALPRLRRALELDPTLQAARNNLRRSMQRDRSAVSH